MGSTAPAGGNVFDRLEKLIEFPVDFPFKVMGRPVDGFATTMGEVVMRHVPDFDPASITARPSSQGNWLGLTLTVRVEHRAQLEALYADLSAHPMVRIIL